MCLFSPWPVKTSIPTRSTEFTSKKESNAHDLQTSFWYQVIIETHPHHHHFHVMTTSRFLICHTTTTSSHHHGTCCPLSKDLVWALSRILWRPAKKTTSRSTPLPESGGDGWIEGKCPRSLQQELDQGEVPSIASNKKTTRGVTSEVVREDGWLDAPWPDPLGRQHQL